MLNRIVLVGRLTKDPESQYTPNGIAIAKFRIAVDRPTKNAETGEKETDFINIVAFRRTAEFVTQYITKGRLVAVDGRLQIRQWVGQDGSRQSMTEVVADNVQGLDRPREGQPGVPGDDEPGAPAPGPRRVPAAPAAAGPANDADDDVDPFADE